MTATLETPQAVFLPSGSARTGLVPEPSPREKAAAPDPEAVKWLYTLDLDFLICRGQCHNFPRIRPGRIGNVTRRLLWLRNYHSPFAVLCARPACVANSATAVLAIVNGDWDVAGICGVTAIFFGFWWWRGRRRRKHQLGGLGYKARMKLAELAARMPKARRVLRPSGQPA